jgi:electron transport complex protein RnfG
MAVLVLQRAFFWVAVSILTATQFSSAQTLTITEGVQLAFPGSVVERKTFFLNDEQKEEARRLAGENIPIDNNLVIPYIAHTDGNPVGIAYFDAHRVRTLQEVIMVAVDTEDRVIRIETMRFQEPPNYRAPGRWMAQFEDRKLDRDLSQKGDIATITGATLTARAVTAAVRRVMALHAVIDPL